MRFSTVFLVTALISGSAFAQSALRSDVKKDEPIYPPSAPTNVATPTPTGTVVPQTAPVAPATLGVPAATVSVPAGTQTPVAPPAQQAQQPAATPGNGTASAMSTGTTIVGTPPATAPATTATPAATPPATAATAVKKTDTTTPTGEDIGFDPKVKRDPYGNVVGTKPTEAQKLRGDAASKLRSDVRPPAAAAPTTATTTAATSDKH